jgi:lipopolysaccharide biosynthesis glycosyltransferase
MSTVVVTAFDENYMKYSVVMLKSLARNYSLPSLLEVVCLVPKNLMKHELEYITLLNERSKLDVKFAYSEKYLALRDSNKIRATDYVTEASYLRLFISSLTSTTHDTAIYIDADALVVRDFKPFLEYPLRNRFMAVLELNPWGKVIFDNQDLPYFNAGVFKTDLNYWRTHDIEDLLVGRLVSNGPTHFMDQDLLNHIFIDVFAPLPNTFNVFSDYIKVQEVIRNVSDPLIIHFAGYGKPWLDATEKTDWTNLWRAEYQKIYPEDTFSKTTLGRGQAIRQLRIYKLTKKFIPMRVKLWLRSRL